MDRSSRAHRLRHKTPSAVEARVCALRTSRKLGPSGWRVHGRDSDQHKTARGGRRVGFDDVHCAINDHTRLAYTELHPDQTAATCAGSFATPPSSSPATASTGSSG